MKNNKGFTLMEIIAALFIGGMVTAALVLVWKISSLQTSQSQRQTIIRNKISTFERRVYKDISTMDVLLQSGAISNKVLLSGFKKARRDDTNFNIADGGGQFFMYCTNKNSDPDKILRYEINFNTRTNASLSSYNDKLSSCRDEGETVLFDVGQIKTAAIDCQNSNGFCNVILETTKTFPAASGATPISINEKFQVALPGGL